MKWSETECEDDVFIQEEACPLLQRRQEVRWTFLSFKHEDTRQKLLKNGSAICKTNGMCTVSGSECCGSQTVVHGQPEVASIRLLF